MKNAKRILSILLSVILVSSFFTMNISAAEENVASIGDVYYNSVEDALEANETFTTLMGDDPELRRTFIEQNAKLVTDLDI